MGLTHAACMPSAMDRLTRTAASLGAHVQAQPGHSSSQGAGPQPGCRPAARVQARSQGAGPARPQLQPGCRPAHSLTAACLQSIEEPSQRDKLQGMVGGMLACLGRTLTSGDEASAQEALTLFIEVAEAHPRFLRKQLAEVVQAMLQVSGARGRARLVSAGNAVVLRRRGCLELVGCNREKCCQSSGCPCCLLARSAGQQ
jgi:hypothetical protein